MLEREYPQMVEKYEQLYASKYVPKDYDKQVQEVVSLMRALWDYARRKAEGRGMGDLGPGIQTPAIVAARGTSASISTCS